MYARRIVAINYRKEEVIQIKQIGVYSFALKSPFDFTPNFDFLILLYR
jgi:hypothetical protein